MKLSFDNITDHMIVDYYWEHIAKLIKNYPNIQKNLDITWKNILSQYYTEPKRKNKVNLTINTFRSDLPIKIEIKLDF